MIEPTIISERIKALLSQRVEKECTIIEYAEARIYIAYQDEEFEYTNLEGCLCLVVNRELQTLLLYLFESICYKKEFEIELYPNIEKGYNEMNDCFHSLQYPFGFIGLNFSNKRHGLNLKNAIMVNSFIFNSQRKNFKILSQKRSEDILLNKVYDMAELQFSQRKLNTQLVNFYIDKANNDIVFEVKKEEIEKTLDRGGKSLISLLDKQHKEIKEKQIKQNENNNNNSVYFKNNKLQNELGFIEYDSTKRKSIFTRSLKAKNIVDAKKTIKTEIDSVLNQGETADRRNSLRHLIHMQNRFNSISVEPPKDINDELKQTLFKLKPIPKNDTNKFMKPKTNLTNNSNIALQMVKIIILICLGIDSEDEK